MLQEHSHDIRLVKGKIYHSRCAYESFTMLMSRFVLRVFIGLIQFCLCILHMIVYYCKRKLYFIKILFFEGGKCYMYDVYILIIQNVIYF